MKKHAVLSLLLAAAMLLLPLTGCAQDPAPVNGSESPQVQEEAVSDEGPEPVLSGEFLYTPGTYEAASRGMNGDVWVSVTFSESEILSVEIGEHNETDGICTLAIEALPEQIVEAQSTDVDVVAGATITSKAILSAVSDCVLQASGEEKALGEISFTPGTYTAQVAGMRGPFDITVTFDEDSIVSVEAGENKETVMVGTEAIRILSNRVTESQSLGVDALSGATVTSNAVIFGIKDCVEQAGGSVDAMMDVPVVVDTYEDRTHEADILVVGGGIAGVTAAISAADNGGDVILLEAKEYLGGNSVLATGLFLLGGTSIQESLGVEDDPDTFFNWIQEHGNYEKDPVQAAWIAYNSQELLDFLTARGFQFNTETLNVTDGSAIRRTHLASPSTAGAFAGLVDYINENGIDVRYATKAMDFILDDNGEIIGVSAVNYYGEPVEYYGNKVVLACGGWADNSEMLAKYWGPDYKNLVYGGSKGMDGTMLNAAIELGAGLTTMDDLHIDATLEVTKEITVTTTVLGSCGGILIRQSTGQRFADEAGNHSEDAADLMHELGDPYYYEIFDTNAFDVSETVANRIQAYVDMGLTTQYDTVEEMAAGIDVDPQALTQTIEEYNAACRGEIDDPFGREPDRFFRELEGPFYVMKVANGVACTTGGLQVNETMQVLDTSGNPIPNLYAIGEITGGYLVHYIGGDSLARSSVSGMMLGKRLATEGV